jgi:hypothetical protein
MRLESGKKRFVALSGNEDGGGWPMNFPLFSIRIKSSANKPLENLLFLGLPKMTTGCHMLWVEWGRNRAA